MSSPEPEASAAASRYPVRILCSFTEEDGARIAAYSAREDIPVRAVIRRFVRAGLTIMAGLPERVDHPEQQQLPIHPSQESTDE